jgi:hypothetical protein
MSFWKKLFGTASGQSVAAKAVEPVEYNGFFIRAVPFQDGGQWQTAGVIEKEIGGVKREHEFIRADRHAAYEDAVNFTQSKARQMIDQMGDRMFDMK